MKTAIKVINILCIIAEVIGIILLFALQGVFKEAIKTAFEAGELNVNGHAATAEDYDMVLKLVPILIGIIVFFLVVSIIILLINGHFNNKDKFTGLLVMGIIFLLSGNYLLGILNIVRFITDPKRTAISQ